MLESEQENLRFVFTVYKYINKKQYYLSIMKLIT
jgi:hypothetical protein